MPVSRQEFEKRVARLCISRSLTRAIYSALEEFQAAELEDSGIELACGEGCSFCCMQTITLTLLEWEEIKRFLLRLRDKTDLRARMEEVVRDFQSYLESHGGPEVPFDPLKLQTDSQDKPCAFLYKERCLVYSVRPMICRIMSSTRRCTSWEQVGGGQMRFEVESHANSFLLERAALEQGQMSVTPLPYLIAIFLQQHPNALRVV